MKHWLIMFMALLLASCNGSEDRDPWVGNPLAKAMAVGIVAHDNCDGLMVRASGLAKLEQTADLRDVDFDRLKKRADFYATKEREKIAKTGSISWCKEVWKEYGDAGFQTLYKLPFSTNP